MTQARKTTYAKSDCLTWYSDPAKTFQIFQKKLHEMGLTNTKKNINGPT